MIETVIGVVVGALGLACYLYRELIIRKLRRFKELCVHDDEEDGFIRLYNASARVTEMTNIKEERIQCVLWMKLVQKHRLRRGQPVMTDDLIRHTVSSYFAVPNYMHIGTMTGYDDGVRCLLVHDNKLFAGGDDSTIRVSRADTYEHMASMAGHTDAVLQHGFGFGVWCMVAHEKNLYSGGGDDPIRVWRTDSHEHVTTLTGHTGVQCMLVHENKLYSGSEDNTIRVYDVETHEPLGHLQGHSGGVQCMVVHGGLLYSGSGDCTVRVWDASTFAPVAMLRGHMGKVVTMLIDDNHLYTGGDDREIRVWDTVTHTHIGTLRGDAEDRKCRDMANPKLLVRACTRGHKEDVRCMLVYKRMLFSGGEDSAVVVWDLDSCEPLDLLEGHTRSIMCMLLHEGVLYTGSADKTVRLWDPDTLECVATLKGHNGQIGAMVIHDKKLYSGSTGGWSNTIRVHNI